MDYELICTDFDNTIRPEGGEVSERTLKAVKEFMDRGGKFNLITGRMYYSIKEYALKYGFKGLIGTYQGAAVFDLETDQMIYCVSLKNELAIKILQIAENAGKFSHVYFNEKFYCEKPNPHTEYYIGYTKTPCVFTGFKNSEFVKMQKFDPIKIVIFDEADRIHVIKKEIDDRFGDVVNTTLSQTTFLEVVDKSVSKGECLKFMAKQLNVPIEKTMSFGDATNDNAMLIAAGMGVAVKNAMKETIAVADYVTGSVYEDGVADAIEKFCLK